MSKLKAAQLKFIATSMEDDISPRNKDRNELNNAKNFAESADQRNKRNMHYNLKQQLFTDALQRKKSLLKFIDRKSLSKLEKKVTSIEVHIKTI